MTINDLAFAATAVVCSIIVISQFIPSLWGFKRLDKTSHEVNVSKTIQGVIVGGPLGVLIVALIVHFAPETNEPGKGWGSIDVVSLMSWNKKIAH